MRQYILSWLRWFGLRNLDTIMAPLTDLHAALEEHADAKLDEAKQHAERIATAVYMRDNASDEAATAGVLANRLSALLGK